MFVIQNERLDDDDENLVDLNDDVANQVGLKENIYNFRFFLTTFAS